MTATIESLVFRALVQINEGNPATYIGDELCKALRALDKGEQGKGYAAGYTDGRREAEAMKAAEDCAKANTAQFEKDEREAPQPIAASDWLLRLNDEPQEWITATKAGDNWLHTKTGPFVRKALLITALESGATTEDRTLDKLIAKMRAGIAPKAAMLEWTYFPATGLYASQRGEEYIVDQAAGGMWRAEYRGLNIGLYPNVDLAKAACQEYHANG